MKSRRGHYPSWPLPDGIMVLETEGPKALGGPGTTPSRRRLSAPCPSSPLSSPTQPLPGLCYPRPLITRGGLLHKGAIFSSLCLWLLYCSLDNRLPNTLLPTPAECTRGPRLGVPSSLCLWKNWRQGVPAASGRLQGWGGGAGALLSGRGPWERDKLQKGE